MGLPDKIIDTVGDTIQGSQDMKEKVLDAEVGFFGKVAELPVLGQTIRALTRPLISWFVILLFGIGQILYWVYTWKYSTPAPEFLPDSLVTIVKWIVGFWFGSRGLQETVKILTKTSKAERKEAKLKKKLSKK